MEDPIKIIYKVKNNNRKNQYHIYIFLGNLVNSSIQKILKKIKDLNLFDSLISLNEKEIIELETIYGIKWYSYFFVHHHIDFSFDTIRKSKQKSEEIIDKLSKEWFDIHIKEYKISGKTSFNYAAIVNRDRINKFAKTITDDERLDYRTNVNQQLGGKLKDSDIINSESDKNIEINNDSKMKKYLNKSFDQFLKLSNESSNVSSTESNMIGG